MTMQSYADSGMAASVCHPFFGPRSGDQLAPPGWWGGAKVARRSPRCAVPCTSYTEVLDKTRGVELIVRFRRVRAEVTDYALVLVARVDGQPETIRVYDGVHGRNEMHRYTRKLGKQPAEVFHRGTLGEGMRTAKRSIRDDYQEMIDGWR
jgi:hypothetical protein